VEGDSNANREEETAARRSYWDAGRSTVKGSELPPGSRMYISRLAHAWSVG